MIEALGKGWKYLALVDGQIVSQYDKSPWPPVGVWRSEAAPERECAGLNCSESRADAFFWVQGQIIAEVEYAGIVIKGDRKLTCERMRLVHVWDLNKIPECNEAWAKYALPYPAHWEMEEAKRK